MRCAGRRSRWPRLPKSLRCTEAAVLAALIDDGGVPASGIEVDAHGDTVTLTGRVDDEAQRNRARRVAMRVGGVAHVHDELHMNGDVAMRDRP